MREVNIQASISTSIKRYSYNELLSEIKLVVLNASNDKSFKTYATSASLLRVRKASLIG